MSNNVPIWAIKAADHLHAQDDVYRTPEVLRENADIIARHAPGYDDLLAAAVNLLSDLSESDFTPQPKDGPINVETKLKFLQLRNAVNKAKRTRMSNHTPAWINRAAIAIINSVDANPAYHFKTKDCIAGNIARVIERHDPTKELLAALNTIAYEPIGDPEASYREVYDGIIEIAKAAIEKSKGQP